MFLYRNRWDINTPMVDVYLKFLNLADGTLNLEELAAWFTQYVVPLEP